MLRKFSCDRDFAVTGTLRWLAPELAHSLTSDEPADVWSIGCIALNMMLSGVRDLGNFSNKLELIKFSTTELENLLQLANEVQLML